MWKRLRDKLYIWKMASVPHNTTITTTFWFPRPAAQTKGYSDMIGGKGVNTGDKCRSQNGTTWSECDIMPSCPFQEFVTGTLHSCLSLRLQVNHFYSGLVIACHCF
ncbi:hypothetical protein B0O80DRAFT_461439 [Mortierella sp. GBAus27b]|nr:hypothetical protein B0O80DRAFT_461439 [Mortierella sp. GBAus27b]